MWYISSLSSEFRVLTRIWNEYGDLESKCPYLIWMRENVDQKKLQILTFIAA